MTPGRGDAPGGGPAPGSSAALGLREAADRLGVHYMTVYRYVRTGRLAAEKVGAEWKVRPRDLERLREAPATAPSSSARRGAKGRLEARLVAGDELGAWSVVEAALSSGAEPAEVHLELVAPALRSIGDRWASGELDVADEHLASAVARRIIGRLGSRFTRRGRKRGTVVVGAAAGELHDIPVSIVADQLRGAGFEVADLGADTPASSFAVAAARLEPLAVVIGVTGSGHDRAVAEAAAAVHRASAVPVLVGGAAVAGEAEALALGADGWSGVDARSVREAVEALAVRPPSAVRGRGGTGPRHRDAGERHRSADAEG